MCFCQAWPMSADATPSPRRGERRGDRRVRQQPVRAAIERLQRERTLSSARRCKNWTGLCWQPDRSESVCTLHPPTIEERRSGSNNSSSSSTSHCSHTTKAKHNCRYHQSEICAYIKLKSSIEHDERSRARQSALTSTDRWYHHLAYASHLSFTSIITSSSVRQATTRCTAKHCL